MYLNHAIVHLSIDKGRPADEIANVSVHVEKKADTGLIVSGAKVVATASALTNANFVAHYGLPPKKSVIFMVPVGALGLKLICRQSYEMAAAHMGSRLDENDSIMVFDKMLIP